MSKAASILDAKLTYLYSRTGGNVVKLGLDTTRALLKAAGVGPVGFWEKATSPVALASYRVSFGVRF